jgi:hypothetical protein
VVGGKAPVGDIELGMKRSDGFGKFDIEISPRQRSLWWGIHELAYRPQILISRGVYQRSIALQISISTYPSIGTAQSEAEARDTKVGVAVGQCFRHLSKSAEG